MIHVAESNLQLGLKDSLYVSPGRYDKTSPNRKQLKNMSSVQYLKTTESAAKVLFKKPRDKRSTSMLQGFNTVKQGYAYEKFMSMTKDYLDTENGFRN
jgi:hypothetical protein